MGVLIFLGENVFEKEFTRESIFIDRDAISPHYLPEKLPFREKQIEEISKLLGVALHGKKPDNLFVYGPTGVGKTATVKHVMQQLQDFAKEKNSKIISTYINCRNHNSKYRAMIKCVNDFYPNNNFVGYSASFVHDKVLDFVKNSEGTLVVVLDEIDKIKDLDDLVYALTRANDELQKGAISIIGISNNLMFKERLDPRTKSSLCEQELVFAPYNASELKAILEQRIAIAFKPNSVENSAIGIAAAFAAKESGDARTAVMLLQRAGELAEKNGLHKITDEEVKKAKSKVEEEVILNMVSALPEQEQLVLYAISALTLRKKGIRKITGSADEGALYSGDVYEEYATLAKHFKVEAVTARWYREYINELEMYGLILTTASGAGIRGNTTLIKLGFDAEKIKQVLEKELMQSL